MRLACIQSDVRFGDPDANVATAESKVREAASRGAQVIVLPEAFLTGYAVGSVAEAKEIALSRTDPRLARLRKLADELSVVMIVGFAEADGETIYNTAALLEAGQPPRWYRKTHLPELGLDHFVTPGDELEVFKTAFGRIGILICFDLRFPEAARALALQGADVLVLPTNWPEGAEVSAESIIVARAAESRIFAASCNRVGREGGFRFFGRSKIVSPAGRVLAAADDQEKILIADLDLAEARQKRFIGVPGRYETETFTARRPELYQRLLLT